MKKYKGVLFIASLVLVVIIFAGCSSNNSITEDLGTQEPVLTIGDYKNGSLTVNGDTVESGWSDHFEAGSDIELAADEDEGFKITDWIGVETDDENNLDEITMVMPEKDHEVAPVFKSDGETGDSGDPDDNESEDGNTDSEELVDFDSINFDEIKDVSSNDGSEYDDDKDFEEAYYELELLGGTISGAKDLNGDLLNGEHDLMILIKDYEGENDKNGYPFTVVFENGEATDIDIHEWEITINDARMNFSFSDDLYLKFR